MKRILGVTLIAIGLLGTGLLGATESRADTPLDEGKYIVNVNTATQEILETIPGIGPVLAQRIIAGRPYKRVDDLERVDGIGKESLKNMWPYVKVEGETERL